MKKIMIIFLLSIGFHSCCSNGNSLALFINVYYPQLTGEKVDLSIIRTEPNDITNVIDTLTGFVMPSNNYQIHNVLQNNGYNPNLIFIIEGTNYRDTISDIDVIVKNKKCKSEKLIKFEYKLNGVVSTDMEIYIE